MFVHPTDEKPSEKYSTSIYFIENMKGKFSQLPMIEMKSMT